MLSDAPHGHFLCPASTITRCPTPCIRCNDVGKSCDNGLERREVGTAFYLPANIRSYKLSLMNNKKEEAPATGAVEVFNFSQEKASIRVQLINNDPWFVAKDVCEILEIGKHRDAVSRLDEDERGSVLVDTLGGKQSVSAVSESGLYSLIFQSRKPQARKFRKWVTSEVLPSIRRKGYYGIRKYPDDYIDARDIPYERVILNECEIRTVEIEGRRWYSVNDVNRSMGSSTESTQCVRKLNARQPLAVKIWLYSVTNPGWFTTELGVRLLLCSGRKSPSRQLSLDFGGKEAGK